MSWWYVIAIDYLVICCLGSIVVINFGCPKEDESKTDTAVARARSRYPVRFRIGLVLAVILLGPLLPLILGYCSVKIWRECRAWRKFTRTHRELTFQRKHVANMPRAAQDHIERHEPVLQELGFTPEGAYLLKPDPLPIYGKCFISQEGESVIDVSLVGDDTAYSFTSILENGHVLESACANTIAATDQINESGRFTADMVERGSHEDCVSKLYQRHRESLSKLEQRFGCGTLHFSVDQVRAVLGYANLVFGEVRFAMGELDAPPRPPVCPQGRAKSVSQRQTGGPAQMTSG